LTKRTSTSWLPIYLGLTLIWGLSFLFIRVALSSFAPLQISFLRIALGALTLFVVAKTRRLKLPTDRKIWLHASVAALLLNVLPFSLYAYGEQRVSSALAGIWNAATPLFTVIFASLLIATERPNRRRTIGLLISFAGVIFVLGPWRGALHSDLIGSLECILATLCYGVGGPYLRRFITGKAGIVEQSLVQLICGTVIMLPIEILTYRAPHNIRFSSLLAIILLGAIGTGVAYLAMNTLYREAGPTIASTVTYVMPIVSTIAGISFLSERVTWNQLAGAAVIIGGMALTQRTVARR
jgi:drug/metabolite transporter (DMT)-like permease